MAKLEEHIYSAQSSLKSPQRLMIGLWNDLLAARQLGWHIFLRDIQVRYRESYLGILWAFIPPILLTVGFTLAARAELINVGKTEVPYPLYVGLGTILWQLFVEALNAPVAAVTSARTMLTKIRFPREALFIAKAGEVLFNFTIKALLLIILFVALNVSPGPLLWLAPFAVLSLLAFGMMIGIFLVPMSVIFQDFVRGVTMLTAYWFFITPVAYEIPSEGMLKLVMELNPITPLLVTARESVTSNQLSYLNEFLIYSPVAFAGLFLSWVILYISMPILIERMNA